MGKILIDTQTEPATPAAGTLALYADSGNSNHLTQKDENGVVIDITDTVGEVNTASNVGTAGVGVFKQKTGVDFEFKKINAGSTKITITDDTGNNEVDIDVAQANLDHGSIGGLSDDDHSQYLLINTRQTTKGDIIVHNGTNVNRLAVGTNGYALLADSGEAAGIKWGFVNTYPEFQFFADQFENPTTSDWAVNALAPAAADSNNSGLNVRLFDDTTEEGVGFSIYIPSGATNIIFDIVSRAETAPGAARTVGLKLYERGLPSTVDSWSTGTALTDIDIGANENWNYDSQTIALSTLGLTANQIHQFELTRINPTGGTELTGDWTLYLLKVSFS